jgi:hypothetical protein
MWSWPPVAIRRLIPGAKSPSTNNRIDPRPRRPRNECQHSAPWSMWLRQPVRDQTDVARPGISSAHSQFLKNRGIAHEGRTVSIQMSAPEWGVSLRPLDRPRPHFQRLCKMKRYGLALHLDYRQCEKSKSHHRILIAHGRAGTGPGSLIIGMARGNRPFQPGCGSSQISLRLNSTRRFRNILPHNFMMHQRDGNNALPESATGVESRQPAATPHWSLRRSGVLGTKMSPVQIGVHDHGRRRHADHP